MGPEEHKGSSEWLPLIGAAALWTPAMIAASYEWGHGEYYDYGWFVPPAAIWLAVRRWREMNGQGRDIRRWWVLVAAVILLPWLLVLRVLGHVDPSWRLPISLLGLTAVVGSHGLIAVARGWRASAGFIWITLLCCSALPWPSVVESGMVRWLTDRVVLSVAEVFQLFGKPVEVTGDLLILHGLTVEVTDGCSGVRSFQSFVMATWFFAELQRLGIGRTMILLGCACGVAFMVNAMRTYALAEIRFVHGEPAFQKAHDLLGLLAFLVSATGFYLISGWLSERPRTKLLRRVRVHPADSIS